LSIGSAHAISGARRPPLVPADAQSQAVTGSASVADSRAGTTVGRNVAGSVLHADSADAVTDANPVACTERSSKPFANGIAYADAVAISTPVDNAIAGTHAFGDARLM
jgi:hypothetical protein